MAGSVVGTWVMSVNKAKILALVARVDRQQTMLEHVSKFIWYLKSEKCYRKANTQSTQGTGNGGMVTF